MSQDSQDSQDSENKYDIPLIEWLKQKDLEGPKEPEKWWPVTKFDIGRDLVNPDWAEWASKRLAKFEAQEKARMDAARAYMEQCDRDNKIRSEQADMYP
jgi:hypothetical protein